MSQRKSTSFSAAKVANFGVVMAEMVVEIGDLRKEIKRLRHHVSVLSKRNQRQVEDGKGGAASSIASDASLGSEDDEMVENSEEGEDVTIRVEGTVVGEEARRLAHGAGGPDPWCKRHQENVGAWSTVVLNAPGLPRGVVVPVVHLVQSDPF